MVGGSVNVLWDDQFQEGDYRNMVLFDKGSVYEESFSSTVQEDLGFNNLFSVCVLVSERQREVHRLALYVSYKYRGDI